MKKWIRLLVIPATAAIMFACSGGGNYELVGVSNFDGYTPTTPYGMQYIHMGSFTMGNNDDDIAYTHTTRPRTVSVASFYIDDTEISNTEYRQFVWYVRDSVARYLLAEEGLEDYYTEDEETGELILNWDQEIDWFGEEESEVLSQLFIEEDEQFYGKAQLDPRQLVYEYYWVDFDQAAVRLERDNTQMFMNSKGGASPVLSHNNRKKYIIKEVVSVYPDTLCWIHDFVGSNNDAMAENYFWHPAYDDYPLVGITWSQAKAFNVWRTNLMNRGKQVRGDLAMPSFRLPTETEWEYAARGGLDLGQYPWGGPYLRNRQGCPLANFKPLRGDYVEDGGFYTVRVDSYEPNDYGLFNMAGNVAEWTVTAYDESVYEYMGELNPDYKYDAKQNELPAFKRKVIRGGSWKDIPYYLQVGTRAYEYQDSAKAYIGMRSAMSYLGRGQDITGAGNAN